MNGKDLERAIRVFEKTNGNVDSRLGRLEGRMDEGFTEIKKDVMSIFTKIDLLPCISHTEKITRNETRIKDMMRIRYLVYGAMVGLSVWVIQHFMVG